MSKFKHLTNEEIQQMTFDWRYRGFTVLELLTEEECDEINEAKGNELTTAGCTTFGTNTLYEDCEFKGFNVGKDNATSFIIISLLSKNSKDGAKGTTVRRCSFHSNNPNNLSPMNPFA